MKGGADGKVIEQILMLRGDRQTVNELERMSRKLEDETAKSRVQATIEEMKKQMARSKTPKRGTRGGNRDDTDLKANIDALLKALQSNL